MAGGRIVNAGSEPGLYYDPYGLEIDTDPYPIWRRLREEQPLYYNHEHGFWALSRFEDVEAGLKDWQNLQLGQGHAHRDRQG